jgi:prepilin-type N-terminal cleavage/methylation domain-containing protein
MGAMNGEKGFSLMEVALAIALLGLVAITFLTALATGSRTIFIADERATAESLARTQMEYVRQQPYDANLDTGHPTYDKISADDIPAGYDIDVSAVRLDYKADGDGNDDGIQSITVTIIHTVEGEDPKEIFTLEGYRARR